MRKIFLYVKIFFLVIVLAPAVLFCSARDRVRYGNEQKDRIDALESAYADPGFEGVNENDFTAFDLSAALLEGIRFNELQFLATHNSYKQRLSGPAHAALKYIVVPLGGAKDEEWNYQFEPLTDQLNRGIRSIELDVVKTGKEKFRCGHVPIYDMNSSASDFEIALKEIKMWSNNNPEHLPITILLEGKSSILSDGAFYRSFNVESAKVMEALVEDAFGDSLFAPKDMLRDYESFGDLRKNNGWPEVSSMLGEILVLFHYSETATDDYIALDPGLQTQKMFPVLEYPKTEVDTDVASFILCNEPETQYDTIIDLVNNKNLLVRTRLDIYPDHPEERFRLGVSSGATILSTDFPPRGTLGEDAYVTALGDGFTVTRK